jgi:CBS domain-containing protein
VVRWGDINAGQGRLTMTVKAILATKGSDVFSIEPTSTLETAVKTLGKHKIGALLVLGPDRRVIGILSERDIVRAIGERGAEVLTQPLSQVMTRKVVTCGQTETVGTIMERMTTGKFRHVPVIEQDQVVGVISIGDVVKYRLHEMEKESAALRDYIQTA